MDSGFIFAKTYKNGNSKKIKRHILDTFLNFYWGIFGVYAVGGGYCSLILPFNVTFFAMALDLL